MTDTNFDQFHNALRIMHWISRDELLQAGIQLDDEEWRSFQCDPYRWFFRASDQNAHEIWAIIQQRQTMTDYTLDISIPNEITEDIEGAIDALLQKARYETSGNIDATVSAKEIYQAIITEASGYTPGMREEIARRLNAYPLLKQERDDLLQALKDALNMKQFWVNNAQKLIAKVEK